MFHEFVNELALEFSVIYLEIPKSDSFNLPWWMRIFLGVRSLWMIPPAWQ